MKLKLVQDSQAVAVSTDDVKAYLRITHSSEDAQIAALVLVARKILESKLHCALIDQTWDLLLASFEAAKIYVPLAPLVSVTSISYVGVDNVTQTFFSDNYEVVTGFPGHVRLKQGSAWPAVSTDKSLPVTVRFVAGFGASAGYVPPELALAIKLLVVDLYTNRSNDPAETTLRAVDSLVYHYRWDGLGGFSEF